MIPAGKTSASDCLKTIADVYRFICRDALSMSKLDHGLWDDTFIDNAWERISQFFQNRAVPEDGLKLDEETVTTLEKHGKNPDRIKDVAAFDAMADAGMDAAHIVAAIKEVEGAVKRLPVDARATAIEAIYAAFEAGMWSGSYLLRFYVDAPAAKQHHRMNIMKKAGQTGAAQHKARWPEYQSYVDEQVSRNPTASWATIKRLTARHFDVSPKTIDRRCKGPRKKL